MKNLSVYNVNSDISTIIRLSADVSEGGVNFVSSPKSWGLVGRDFGEVDGGPILNKTIVENKELHTLVGDGDTVLFDYLEDKNSGVEDIFRDIRNVEKKGAHIILTERVPLYEEFESDSSKLYRLTSHRESALKDANIFWKWNHMFDLDSPAILLYKMGNHCDTFYTLVSLKNFFSKLGYKVLAVSADPLAKLFDIESVPQFLYDNISIEEKTVRLNQSMKLYEQNNDIDIFLIDVPGNMMPINSHHHNGFSYWADMFTYAAKPEIGIVSTYLMEFTEQYFRELTNMCKYRYGLDKVFFNVCNYTMEKTGPDSQAPLLYGQVRYDVVNEKIKDLLANEHKIFSIYNKELLIDSFNFILNDSTASYASI